MNSHRLLAYFFKNCKKQFRFLKNDHGFSSLAGMADYERGRYIIHPYNEMKQIDYPYCALVRYERNDIAFEVIYGDYNFSIESFVTYGRRYRFALGDIVASLPDKRAHAPIVFTQDDDVPCAPQIHHLRAYLQTTQEQLSCYADYLFDSVTDSFLDQAFKAQQYRIEAAVRQRYIKQKENACKRAAEAFREQDYKRAIMLYRPYKKDLNSVELRILSLAISYLGH